MLPTQDKQALSTENLDTLDTPKDAFDLTKETILDTNSAALGAAPSDLSTVTTMASTTTSASATLVKQAQDAGEEPSKKHPPVYEGDGEDPYNTVIPEPTAMDWIAYTVSLNYNKLATSFLSPLTRWHWYDRIPNTPFILGAVPSEELLPQLVKDEGVTDIVNMCAEFKGHLEKMQELGLRQCWIPTRDFNTPSVESIWIGVRYIEKCRNRKPQEGQGQGYEERANGPIISNEDHIGSPQSGRQEGDVVYLHCKAGRGRSATVALCWLLYAYKLTRIEAQVILLKARGQVDKSVYFHPEVIEFERQVNEQEQQGSVTRREWPSNGL